MGKIAAFFSEKLQTRATQSWTVILKTFSDFKKLGVKAIFKTFNRCGIEGMILISMTQWSTGDKFTLWFNHAKKYASAGI